MIANQIAKHMKSVFFGGNWTDVNFKDTLADVKLDEVNVKIHDFNTIASLTAHSSYYIYVISRVLDGQPLEGKDKESFDHPSFKDQQDWDAYVGQIFHDASKLAGQISNLSDQQLTEDFTNEKYGNYFRNLIGMIEHTHYHLGQIVLIKKLIRAESRT